MVKCLLAKITGPVIVPCLAMGGPGRFQWMSV